MRDDTEHTQELIKTLVKNDADPNVTFLTNNQETTPLLAAIEQENVDAVKALLFVGTDANKGAAVGYQNRITPLSYALEKQIHATHNKNALKCIIEMLLEHGAYI